MLKLACCVMVCAGLIGCTTEITNMGGSRKQRDIEAGRTSIWVSGPEEAMVSAKYKRAGKPVEVETRLPWGMDAEGISSFEIHKLNPADTVEVKIEYTGPKPTRASIHKTLGPGTRYISGEIDDGIKTITHSR